MPLLLAAAESSPDPIALKQWLEVLLYLCGIILAVAGVWKLLTGKAEPREIANQPLSVKEAHDAATKAELEKLEKKVEAENAKHTSARKGIYQSLDQHAQRISGVEQAVKATSAEIVEVKSDLKANTAMTSEMRGEVKGMTQNVQNLTNSITNFLRDQAQPKR